MRGTYNSKGVDTGGNVIAPPGEYTLVVSKVFDTDKQGNPKTSSKGDPMVAVLCEIDDVGPYLGATVWNNVVFMKRNEDGSAKKGSGLAVRFLKSIGEDWGEGGKEFDWDSDRWVGRTFRAKLKVGKDQNQNPRNEIAEILDEQKPPEGKSSEDDIPF